MPDPSPITPPPAVRRDGVNALLLLVLVAAALVLGYRRTTPETLAAQPDATRAAARSVSSGYDLDQAMALAGKEVPPGTDSFYFFAFVEEAPAEQEIGDLAEKLQEASKERDFLGIAGPDAERNRRNLLAALRADAGKDLGGAVIIYVGPLAQREEIADAMQSAGAQLRFVTYPEFLPELKPGS